MSIFAVWGHWRSGPTDHIGRRQRAHLVRGEPGRAEDLAGVLSDVRSSSMVDLSVLPSLNLSET